MSIDDGHGSGKERRRHKSSMISVDQFALITVSLTFVLSFCHIVAVGCHCQGACFRDCHCGDVGQC